MKQHNNLVGRNMSNHLAFTKTLWCPKLFLQHPSAQYAQHVCNLASITCPVSVSALCVCALHTFKIVRYGTLRYVMHHGFAIPQVCKHSAGKGLSREAKSRRCGRFCTSMVQTQTHPQAPQYCSVHLLHVMWLHMWGALVAT